MPDAARFDRLEAKIDKLTDAVTTIARVEEKILASNHRLENLEIRATKNEDDIDEIAKLVRENGVTIKLFDRIFMLAVGAVFSILVSMAKF